MDIMPHTKLSRNLNIDHVILPGDPARCDRIAEHFENAELLAFNREYKSIAGTYNGINILAMSTGMGGPSVAIGIEELAAIGITSAIRIGSAGSLQPDIDIGDLVLATSAVRQEGTTKGYAPVEYPAVADFTLLNLLNDAVCKRKYPYKIGIVRSHDCLFGSENTDVYDVWTPRKVLASDMETAALFVVAGIRGIKAGSVLNIVSGYEGDVAENVGRYNAGSTTAAEGEEREILTALDALASVDV